MSFKPVVLIYDLDNSLVDEIAAEIGAAGLYTSINTYNEANAMDVIRQYNRGFGLLTNKLSCVITGWNTHKKPSDQFLYRLRQQEAVSPLRGATPVIIITEDHRADLKQRALNTSEGAVSAYLHRDTFKEFLTAMLHKIVFEERAEELNQQSLVEFQSELGSLEQEAAE
jgi:CheY-like chemotaxis protein